MALLDYANTLASGDALTVRRLGQHVDYSVDILSEAVWRARERQGWNEHDPKWWPRWNGIYKALVKALGDAEDRAYRRRQRRRE